MQTIGQHKKWIVLGTVLTITTVLLALVAYSKLSHVQSVHAANTEVANSSQPKNNTSSTANTTVSTDKPVQLQSTTKSSPLVLGSGTPIPEGSQGSISSQNIEQPEVGMLTGHTTYDASGNACGIGPTGICIVPFAGRTIEVRDGTGNLVASLVSDSTGSFSCELKPGTYTVIPGPGEGVNPSANSQQVIVSKGTTIDITVEYWAIATTNSPVQF